MDIEMTIFKYIFTISIIIFTITLIYIKKTKNGSNINNDGTVTLNNKTYKIPQLVEGSLPIIGHGVSFSKDIIKFVSDAHHKYGGIFKVKIFNNDMIIISDRKYVREFLQSKESNLSLYEQLNNLYFGNAFTDDDRNMSMIIRLVKRTIAIRFDDFIPKITNYAIKMIDTMKKEIKDGSEVDIYEHMIKFIVCTSSGCFVGMEMTPEFYHILEKFTSLLNKLVVLTYFLPKNVIKYTIGRLLRKYRNQMAKMLYPIIEEYRIDKTKKDSDVIRSAVDDVTKLDNHRIAEILICLLFVSAENTALGLAATVRDLSKNKEWWDKVKEKSSYYLNNDNLYGLFNDELIDAVIMETGRMNTHIFALNRHPVNKNTVIGDYYVGNVKSVAICQPLLMVGDASSDIYSNGEQYNPGRFLDKCPISNVQCPISNVQCPISNVQCPMSNLQKIKGESKKPYDMMTWGAGTHICPGKVFAKHEIKAAIALLTTNFYPFDIVKEDPKNYFSPAAFAEQNAIMKIKFLPENELIKNINLEPNIDFNNEYYKVLRYDTPDGNGWLIKNFLNEEKQKQFYKDLVNASIDSNEQKELTKLINTQDNNTYPLTYYNLVYTNTSNCSEEKIDFMLNFANKLWDSLHKNKRPLKFPGDIKPKFNSVYSQLYPEESKMNLHKDQYVDWGISISIGASCVFIFGNNEVSLSSGDVFIADFSKVEHGIDSIDPETTPEWFKNENTFGRIRCSIQIREVKQRCENEYLTNDEFKKLIKN
jgi:cytochrome P450